MRRFAVLILVLAGMAQAAEGLSAYLPKVGPAPLRFRPPPRSVAPLALPALAMADPAPSASAPRAQPTPGPSPLQPPTEVAGPPADFVDTLLADAISPVPDPVVPMLPQDPTPAAAPPPNITPQMLVKFFNQQPGASNRVRGEFLVAPGFFTPATPPGSGHSSTATYTTPK